MIRLAFSHLIALAAIIGLWHLGLFAGFTDALHSVPEAVMIGGMALYGIVGIISAVRGNWRIASHVANGLPIWGLVLTGLGLLLAAADIHEITPATAVHVFQSLTYAIAPNIIGVLGLAWIREILHWVHAESV